MSIREFKKSALLLLETVSTFSASELLDYQSFIFYTVLVSVVSLDRVQLKEKVKETLFFSYVQSRSVYNGDCRLIGL